MLLPGTVVTREWYMVLLFMCPCAVLRRLPSRFYLALPRRACAWHSWASDHLAQRHHDRRLRQDVIEHREAWPCDRQGRVERFQDALGRRVGKWAVGNGTLAKLSAPPAAPQRSRTE